MNKDKFTVLKNDDLNKYLTDDERDHLHRLINKVTDGRIEDRKNANNKYIVVNKDETFAINVAAILQDNDMWDEDETFLHFQLNDRYIITQSAKGFTLWTNEGMGHNNWMIAGDFPYIQLKYNENVREGLKKVIIHNAECNPKQDVVSNILREIDA